jgi:hypothetical protein
MAREPKPPGQRRPTRSALRWLLVGLLVAATAVVVTSASALATMRRTATDYQLHGQPSIAAASAARQALVEADLAAAESFRDRGETLVGPGSAYRDQLSVVTQSLARAAENNVAGAAGSQLIELVDGLLVAYTGLIGHADAYCRLGADCPLGQVYLKYAGNLLTDILAQLDNLLKVEEDAVAQQVSAGGTNTLWISAWAVPCLALLVLLVAAQVYLRRRFRRTLNPALVAATAVLLAVVAVMAVSLDAGSWIGHSRDRLDAANAAWHQWQDQTRDRQATTSPDAVDQVAAKDVRQSAEHAARAVAGTADQMLVLGGALLVVALTAAGLIPRIEEYRYRSR